MAIGKFKAQILSLLRQVFLHGLLLVNLKWFKSFFFLSCNHPVKKQLVKTADLFSKVEYVLTFHFKTSKTFNISYAHDG